MALKKTGKGREYIRNLLIEVLGKDVDVYDSDHNEQVFIIVTPIDVHACEEKFSPLSKTGIKPTEYGSDLQVFKHWRAGPVASIENVDDVRLKQEIDFTAKEFAKQLASAVAKKRGLGDEAKKILLGKIKEAQRIPGKDEERVH